MKEANLECYPISTRMCMERTFGMLKGTYMDVNNETL